MKNIFIISGLGADERVFQRLDFSGFNPIFIKWIPPLKHETIEHYAFRLLKQITSVRPLIIGLSFGGLIAIEIAKQIKTEKIILISSAKTYYEIPFYFKLFGKIKLHKLLPGCILKKSNFIIDWFFGAGSTFDKQLLKEILKDTDIILLKWAIDKIVNWHNQSQITNLIQIHGTSDKVLPIYFIRNTFKINKGGHFMILNKPDELTQMLRKLI